MFSPAYRYEMEARALAAMVGEVLVVAYEHSKRPNIADALNRWSAATRRKSRADGAEGAAAVATILEDFERDTLVSCAGSHAEHDVHAGLCRWPLAGGVRQ